jgi:hypothetical protein
VNIKSAAVLGVAVAFVVGFVGCSIGYPNQEQGVRNLIKAKSKDNESEFDAMWKEIAQAGQIPDHERESLHSLVVDNAQARTTGGAKDGSLMKWVQESIPTPSPALYDKLMNIITAKRDGFAMRQKELLDLGRRHDDLITQKPSKWFIGMFGDLTPIEIKIVTSTRTDEVFRTGKDDDVELFKKK